MKLFRTVVKYSGSPEKFDYHSSLLMVGSCFAEHIGIRLKNFKFNVVLNPFGIVYNPVSAAQSVDRVMLGNPYTHDDLIYHNGLWCSFDHHGRFSSTDPDVCLQQINEELFHAHKQLPGLNWLFVTFGTAWAYQMVGTERVVANCHKYPAAAFERVRLGLDMMVDKWQAVIFRLRQINPGLNIVFTVSPIRHLRDGAHENQLSKSLLLLAVDRLCQEYTDVTYFPAYEIMLDELRDYRFYDEDMLHPGTTAIDYIWQAFGTSYITESANATMDEVEAVVKAAAHRPIHHTAAHRNFVTACLEKIKALQQKQPGLDFTRETGIFRKMLE